MMDTDAVVLCATQQSKLNISHVDNFLSAIVEAWLEERKKKDAQHYPHTFIFVSFAHDNSFSSDVSAV